MFSILKDKRSSPVDRNASRGPISQADGNARIRVIPSVKRDGIKACSFAAFIQSAGRDERAAGETALERGRREAADGTQQHGSFHGQIRTQETEDIIMCHERFAEVLMKNNVKIK